MIRCASRGAFDRHCVLLMHMLCRCVRSVCPATMQSSCRETARGRTPEARISGLTPRRDCGHGRNRGGLQRRRGRADSTHGRNRRGGSQRYRNRHIAAANVGKKQSVSRMLACLIEEVFERWTAPRLARSPRLAMNWCIQFLAPSPQARRFGRGATRAAHPTEYQASYDAFHPLSKRTGFVRTDRASGAKSDAPADAFPSEALADKAITGRFEWMIEPRSD